MLSAGLPLAGGSHLLLQNHRNRNILFDTLKPIRITSFTVEGDQKLSFKVGGTVSFPPLKAAKRVVLVRHGQSTWNAEGRIQGSSDFSILTNKGEAQAETSRQMLIDDSFDICFSRFQEVTELLPQQLRDVLHLKNKEIGLLYFRTPDPWNIHDYHGVPKKREDGWMEVVVWEFNSTSGLLRDWDDELIKLFEELRNAVLNIVQVPITVPWIRYPDGYFPSLKDSISVGTVPESLVTYASILALKPDLFINAWLLLGAALAYVSSLMRVPAIFIKAVSNFVDGEKSIPEEFAENLQATVVALGEVVANVVEFINGKCLSEL
ncbi:phosphoglycerate/bisphosphoglycerate mutase family protein [Artemisia annua]|uniref:Phosphoglycerate/bisphosphoglycerate mutase family protein n=1 Tax=Artemisia annua TaxID=35608 RepID=A0A2U1PGW1_ARTAN|nr:phosphoglycerate/bisphosphoglycerate mutase family protein [Artemisia annua]